MSYFVLAWNMIIVLLGLGQLKYVNLIIPDKIYWGEEYSR